MIHSIKKRYANFKKGTLSHTSSLPKLFNEQIVLTVCIVAIISMTILFRFIYATYLHPTSDFTTPPVQANNYLVNLYATLKDNLGNPLPSDIDVPAQPGYNFSNVLYLGDAQDNSSNSFTPPRFQGIVNYYPNTGPGGLTATPVGIP